MQDFAPYLLSLAFLVSLSAALLFARGINLWLQPYVAIIRAIVQLTLIALLLHGVLSAPWAVVLFIGLMLTTATATSAKHSKALYRGRAATALGIVCGALTATALIFALRMVPFTMQNLVAVAGIITGGTMTIATLTARNFLSLTLARTGEVEGWWALGAGSPIAFSAIAKDSIVNALTPGLDQTRATGLVTLPGTFVGALMGGASPVLAVQLQIAVLAGQTLGGTIAALIFTSLVSRSSRLPANA